MAEFQEVMKQAKRMCNGMGASCSGCPMNNNDNVCIMIGSKTRMRLPEEFDMDMLTKAEHIVMDWAAKSPEPRYPTWKEWQKANFPDAAIQIGPCRFTSKERAACSCKYGCEECFNQPIPADIAEKLGIKPIGGGADA